MLENEEVDDDYFTPIAKTSLASIFKKPLSKEITENETLKYTPPSPKTALREDEPKVGKTYDNKFSCVFDAYQWLDNVYTHKGKLGCAVVKLTTDGCLNFHSVLLYDSKKTTVSTAIATKDLEVTVKGNNTLSYYDSYQKYWCLYGSEDDIKKVIEVLKTCDVKINSFNNDGVIPVQIKPATSNDKMESANIANFEAEQNKIEVTDVKMVNTLKKNIESDTDSSLNRKTKASILNRMASMGQSVLPLRTVSNELTSYSSDSNESDNQIVAVRPKPSMIKKNISEKNVYQQQQKSNIQKKSMATRIPYSIENNTSAIVEDQLMPLHNSSIITSTSGNDLSFFITEQRIANSELRINMSRMTDKVDHILNKLDNLEVKEKEGTANINAEILQKLLKEYEDKIKTYEERVKKIDKDTNVAQKSTSSIDLVENLNKELMVLRKKNTELNECVEQRDNDICLLNREIENLKAASNVQNEVQSKDELLMKISELKRALSERDTLLADMKGQNDELSERIHDDQLESKIKTIMNDTFRAAAANFDMNYSYSGEEVHNIIAAVIKKVTIESLHRSK